MKRLARLRVPLGFLCAAVALALVRPSWATWPVGAAVAAMGECLRLWAAGHIDKGREITRSGPYRFLRHPLYVGSTLIGLGFALASGSVIVWALTTVYLGVTLAAAVRTEERTLDERFDGAYSEYREGRAVPVDRPFTWARVMANREYRAVTGVLIAFSWLLIRLR
ncbi:MAG: isoprenylcysteine carboxylmethyltransferase family protein [Acidobacteriota bacterium]